MEKKYIYHVNIYDIEDSVFCLLDRLGMIKQSNYEGNGWMKVEADELEADIIEMLEECDRITTFSDVFH